MFSRFSSNSKAYASELLENLEDDDAIGRLKSSTTHGYVTRHDCLKLLLIHSHFSFLGILEFAIISRVLVIM